MIFSQSVVSVVTPDPHISRSSLTQWGGNDTVYNNEETLDKETLERKEIHEAQQANANSSQDTEELHNTAREQQSLPVGLEPWLPLQITNAKTGVQQALSFRHQKENTVQNT